MDQAGSRTQLPSIVAAGLALLLLVFGTGVLEDVPSPAIGAVVAVAVVPLLALRELKALWQVDPFEFAVAGTCFVGTLVLGPIAGILIAFVLSLVNLARRAASPAVDLLSSDADADNALKPLPAGETTTSPGVIVMRFAAPIFFANASQLVDSTQSAVQAALTRASNGGHPLKHFVIDMEGVTDIDVTGAEGIAECRAWLASREVELHFSRVRPEVRDLLTHYSLGNGADTYGTNRDAIAALTSLPPTSTAT